MHTYCIALGPTHDLPVVEPLGGKHFVEATERELTFAQNGGQAGGGKAAQVALEVPLVLLLRPELAPAQSPHHRAAASPPLLRVTRT